MASPKQVMVGVVFGAMVLVGFILIVSREPAEVPLLAVRQHMPSFVAIGGPIGGGGAGGPASDPDLKPMMPGVGVTFDDDEVGENQYERFKRLNNAVHARFEAAGLRPDGLDSELGVSMMTTLSKSKRPFLQCDRESAAAWRAEYYLPNGTFYSPVKAKQNTVANKKIHYWQERATHAVSAATNALWSNGFPIVLASGTLLGWYRQCGVVEYTTDTDMMVDHAFFTDPDVFANITSILREAGFRPIDVLGEWDSPGAEARFRYYGDGSPPVQLDLFTMGWDGDKGFTNIHYSKERILRCYFGIYGWDVAEWNHRLFAAPSNPVGYIEDVYKDKWHVPPKTDSYQNCKTWDRMACDAYSYECEGARRTPILHKILHFVVEQSQADTNNLPIYPLWATLEKGLGTASGTLDNMDFGVMSSDREAWTTALGARDRLAGLSTFDVYFEDETLEHRSAEVLDRDPGRLRPFAEIFFSVRNPVSVRLWEMKPIEGGGYTVVGGGGLVEVLSERVLAATTECSFGDVTLYTCLSMM